MRFNTKVTFYKESSRYVPGQGYGGKSKVAEIMANVTDLGTNRSKQLFGDVDTGNKVIRLVRPVGSDWDTLTIEQGLKTYVSVTEKNVLKGLTLIVGEKHG